MNRGVERWEKLIWGKRGKRVFMAMCARVGRTLGTKEVVPGRDVT